MSESSSVFDMIGPVMIGPSSSHTAGVVRIGRVARKILKSIPKKAIITFYNSFARTYEGHGSNRAILGGLMDYHTDDERIKDALSLAEQVGLEFHFKSVGNASTLHPNTVKLELTSAEGDSAVVIGESRGGGVIRMRSVNGFDTNFTASSHTLIVYANDQMGSIAFISDVLSHDDCNIATMTVSRKGKNDLACLVFEMDSGIKPITLAYISELNWVRNVLYIPDIDQ
ncbi:MAG: L-serine ammonia-lyase, iron-sulfur-dependent, subunit beta [Flammeovirgaceae bacterium]|nr:L-serine ammonia-lyase, iron-sulfur-dependent, subunit beta [Flammeovirgaceae bacterium]MBR08107.1 L-serine ammonia-lyase, iron-sulfur-dependent, subunit beta [Rickettsiales bacterium]HCX21430.1 L-serine ammonia-lyase, iron-sulfur-dependent, subunit beta [Cytophagales bacterium]|tara:strand:- start:1235 stop:1915 length:681 start_codon:yes stop_codon:yes gene_type:complete